MAYSERLAYGDYGLAGHFAGCHNIDQQASLSLGRRHESSSCRASCPPVDLPAHFL